MQGDAVGAEVAQREASKESEEPQEPDSPQTYELVSVVTGGVVVIGPDGIPILPDWRKKRRRRPQIEPIVSKQIFDAQGNIIGEEGPEIPKEKPEEFSRTVFEACQHLPAIRKMNHGWFDDLTVDDVQELFTALDEDESGLLEFEEIRLLLKEVMDPPCADDAVDLLWEFTDMNEDNCITRNEFHSALVAGPIKSHIRHVQEEFKLREKYAKIHGLHAHVDRNLMRDTIAKRVENDDTFASLPIAIIFIMVFITVVTTHLHVWDRQRVQTGLRNWVSGYGQNLPGPYMFEHVGNVDQMWQWVDSSGLESLFGACATQPEPGWTECRLADLHVLLTDVQLRQTGLGEAEESAQTSWLVSSALGQAHLASSPGDYLGAARAQLAQLHTSWKDRHAERVEARFVTYLESMEMFTSNVLVATFDSFGRPRVYIVSYALVIAPYKETWVFGLDSLYVALILYGMVFELKDLCSNFYELGVRAGLIDYFSLWNAIDWLGISMGFFNMLLWGLCVLAMSADSIQGLLTYDVEGVRLKAAPMELGVDGLETLVSDLDELRLSIQRLHNIMGVNVLTVVLRFFKAFRSNPRLSLVTATMRRASIDIVHFAIVFLSVFIAFALLGHIYFGNDLLQFASFGQSINTAFVVLMGDFDFYMDVWNTDTGLPSGMPMVILLMWFWFYMVGVLLVLLNMLLAIIMEHYAFLVDDLRSMTDCPTIWRQADKYLAVKRETRDFISLPAILMQLDRKEDPAHQKNKVTHSTLMSSFPGVQQRQADWMMSFLRKASADRFITEETPREQFVSKEINSIVDKIADSLQKNTTDVSSFNEEMTRLKATGYLKQEDGLDLRDPKQVSNQQQVQGSTISQLSRQVASLHTRMDQLDPKEGVPSELLQMKKDLASIKSTLGMASSVPPSPVKSG